jgi:DNA-binding MarR family transcriptional regulator
VVRIPDPDDGRAQRVQLTDSGLTAVNRIRDASRRGIEVALTQWSAEDLRHLAGLFHRLVDDFVTYAEAAVDLETSA